MSAVRTRNPYSDIDDDDDEEEEETSAQFNERMYQRFERTQVKILEDAIHAPKLYVRQMDPVTGFPMGESLLVNGGAEVLHSINKNIPLSQQDIPGSSVISSNAKTAHRSVSSDAVFNGDTTFTGETIRSSQESSNEQKKPVRQLVNQNLMLQSHLSELGLDFLEVTPSPASQHVQLAFEGQTSFKIPFSCHKVLNTNSMVVLITDTRSVSAFQDFEYSGNRNDVSVNLLLPDGTEIPVAPPVPKTLSFELGVIRCTLFAKIPPRAKEPG